MRQYQPLWNAVKEATKTKPVQVRSRPENYPRIVQAVFKEKSRENRIRRLADAPMLEHSGLNHEVRDGVLYLWLDLNGDTGV